MIGHKWPPEQPFQCGISNLSGGCNKDVSQGYSHPKACLEKEIGSHGHSPTQAWEQISPTTTAATSYHPPYTIHHPPHSVWWDNMRLWEQGHEDTVNHLGTWVSSPLPPFAVRSDWKIYLTDKLVDHSLNIDCYSWEQIPQRTQRGLVWLN